MGSTFHAFWSLCNLSCKCTRYDMFVLSFWQLPWHPWTVRTWRCSLLPCLQQGPSRMWCVPRSHDGVGKIAENCCGTIGCTRTIYGDSTYIALFVDFLGLFASFSATYWLFIVVTTLVTLDVFNHFPRFLCQKFQRKKPPQKWVGFSVIVSEPSGAAPAPSKRRAAAFNM